MEKKFFCILYNENKKVYIEEDNNISVTDYIWYC